MAGKHRITRRQGGVVAVATLSALVVTAGYASAATPEPIPVDCTAVVQSIITAQVGENGKSAALRTAERKDAQARDTHDKAVTDAQEEYLTAVGKSGATDADKSAALSTRAAEIQRADDTYTTGGTAARLEHARAAEGKTSGVLAGVKLELGRYCVSTPTPPAATPPAPVTVEVPVPAAPAPVVQGSDRAVTVTH